NDDEGEEICDKETTPYFFFFSSRRRHTSWPRDWSSDVCSSDLLDRVAVCRNWLARLPQIVCSRGGFRKTATRSRCAQPRNWLLAAWFRICWKRTCGRKKPFIKPSAKRLRVWAGDPATWLRCCPTRLCV